jgi:alkanesulfonate monooxygenase SsuD/methylene tetrahydromethanopterin reductase-like flavin-dependent oxidoreductase (luciferase family)/pimeloyl-ACP methyl ester carboxylesterase
VRIFSFHLMPYPALPAGYDGPAWVTCPNRFYDPELGGRLYNRYLDELLYADELGFDGVCVNEHHQNAYGTMPSPNLIAAALARQTRNARIAVVGNALPLYDPPTRVAEEFAMIDCLSGGRLIAGLVVGGGPEYFSFSINPAHARERFAEAHELIVRAWTEPGPFEFVGKHYRIRYVNPWPRPVQQPHPEIWIPGAGSLETVEFVARHRYAYMGIPYFHIDVFDRMFRLMREACQREGYEADPLQLGWLVPIFVADSDEEARERYEEHFWYFVRRLLPGITISPPGYTSIRSYENILKGVGTFAENLRTWEQVVEGQYAIVGSPQTVTELLTANLERLGAGNLLGLFQLGTLPADDTQRSMELFASEVAPQLRARFPGTERRELPPVRREPGGKDGHAPSRTAVPVPVVTAPEASPASLPPGNGTAVDGSLETAVGRVVVWHAEPAAGSELPLVVYLHSAAGEDGQMNGRFMESLAAKGWRVVAPMFPGYAGSDGLAEIEDIEDAVFHLSDLLERLGAGTESPPHLVGCSLGGWMAVELAARYPERVRTLTLVNAVGLYIAGAPVGEIFGRQLDELAGEVFADADHPVAAMMRALAEAQRTDPSAIPFELVRPYLEAQAAAAKIGWDPYLHDPRLPKLLRRVAAPTLVVAGALDGLVPLAHARAYTERIAGARLEIVPDIGHMLPLEAPDTLAELVANHAGAATGGG